MSKNIPVIYNESHGCTVPERCDPVEVSACRWLVMSPDLLGRGSPKESSKLESCNGSATAVTTSCRMLFHKEEPGEQEVASGVASRSRLAVATGGSVARFEMNYSRQAPLGLTSTTAVINETVVV